MRIAPDIESSHIAVALNPADVAERVNVAFRGGDGVRRFARSRLDDIETVHATTIHMSHRSG